MEDGEARARSAGLKYIQDFENGYSRRKCGKGFKFIDAAGKAIKDRARRDRCLGLVIPPAWTDVWICPDADGHIQATGFDNAGRKQYIYHPKWHEASAAHKYGRLRLFANLLPKIRRRVQTDLKKQELSKERIVAAVVRLLDKACIRVGNKQYLEANDSRGATTLTAEHVCRTSSEISLSFKGKSGKEVELKCHDEGLAAVIADCENSDGEFLFSYENANGDPVPITSSDVNAYLLEVTGESITAKDFRTWRGSVLALAHLSAMEEELSKTAKKRFIVQAVKSTAEALANTPAVCRKSYIHSAILLAAEAGELPALLRKIEKVKPHHAGLTSKESKLYAFLCDLEGTVYELSKRRRAMKNKIAA